MCGLIHLFWWLRCAGISFSHALRIVKELVRLHKTKEICLPSPYLTASLESRAISWHRAHVEWLCTSNGPVGEIVQSSKNVPNGKLGQAALDIALCLNVLKSHVDLSELP